MLEGTNEMRFASLDDMLRAGRFPVRKWSKDDAGIEDLDKIGLKGSPTVVSKVFGPTPRTREGRDAGAWPTRSLQRRDAEPAAEDLHHATRQLEAELVERLSPEGARP